MAAGSGAAEWKQVCSQFQQKSVEDMDDGAYDDIKPALSHRLPRHRTLSAMRIRVS